MARVTYGLNPFPESLEIARYIESRSTESDRIVVIGSEPQIYFYSGRRSATGFIYTYPLMEAQSRALEMQKDMIREIEENQTDYLVYVNTSTSWLSRTESHRHIFEWYNAYQEEHLDLVGFVESTIAGSGQFSWGEDARRVRPRTSNWLAVYRAKAQYP